MDDTYRMNMINTFKYFSHNFCCFFLGYLFSFFKSVFDKRIYSILQSIPKFPPLTNSILKNTQISVSTNSWTFTIFGCLSVRSIFAYSLKHYSLLFLTLLFEITYLILLILLQRNTHYLSYQYIHKHDQMSLFQAKKQL